jgi:hypothetical protein
VSDTEYDDPLPTGAYTGSEGDDSPCVRMGVDEEAETVEDFTRFIASTEREDRHRTVIDQASWDLGDYRRNPIVLLNHRSGALPIGRSEIIEIVEKGKRKRPRLELGVRWDMADPEAVLVAGKYARRFLNAGSVSFAPVKITDRAKLPEDHYAHRKPREDDSPWYPAVFFEKQKLLEFSGVTIPSNVEAEALRSWGARQLAEIRTDAATIEDPDARVRRIATEIVDARGLDLVMRALRTGSIELRAVLADLVFGRKAPVEPPSNRQFSDWWNQEKP